MTAERASFVVTGGAEGTGRAIAEHSAVDGEVIVLDVTKHLGWEYTRVALVSRDTANPNVAARAVQLAERAGPLTGGSLTPQWPARKLTRESSSRRGENWCRSA